jgi:hypothetical protein
MKMREQQRGGRRVGSWNEPWFREVERTPKTITHCLASAGYNSITEDFACPSNTAVAQDAEMELLDNIGHWLCGFRRRGELPWKTKELPLGICSG